MRPAALGRVAEVAAQEKNVQAAPQIVEAVNALLFGLTLAAPLPVPISTPLELACLHAAEAAASLDTAPHTHVSARALESVPSAPANDGARAHAAPVAAAAQRVAGSAERTREGSALVVGPSSADIEALVRLAAARAAAPMSIAVSAPAPTAAALAPQAGAAPRVVVPALLSSPATQVEFGQGGADATIDIAHPTLGPIRLEMALTAGGVVLRAMTPSTVTASALRALEPTIARALSVRGFALRSLRVDVGSDSRATVSRAQRRRNDFEEEA